MIAVRGLSKSYGKHRVLDNVSVEIQRGETVALLGPSGSGKTTLLRCLNGLEKFDAGEVEVDGIILRVGERGRDYERRLREIRCRCGFVFQQYQLFPHKSVLENITMAPVNVKRIAREQAIREALALLEQVGLRDKAHQFPGRLSGGEQQRVAITRALALHPDYLLYDEPTSALDPARAYEVWGLMNRLRESGQTQVIVTHQEELTRHVECRVVRMSGGRIEDKS